MAPSSAACEATTNSVIGGLALMAAILGIGIAGVASVAAGAAGMTPLAACTESEQQIIGAVAGAGGAAAVPSSMARWGSTGIDVVEVTSLWAPMAAISAGMGVAAAAMGASTSTLPLRTLTVGNTATEGKGEFGRVGAKST